MASPEEQMRDLISKIGQKPDSVNYKWGAFELHYYGREGRGDGDARARRTLSNLHGYLRRTGIDTHAAYVQPIDPRDPSRGSMIIVQASAFDKFSRPGAPDTFAVEDRFYFGKGRKERFASHSTPRQSTTSGPSGTWKKIELSVGGKKAWHTELIRGSVLVGWVDQHPNTRQWHAFDGKTDQQIGVGSESEMKRLVESL